MFGSEELGGVHRTFRVETIVHRRTQTLLNSRQGPRLPSKKGGLEPSRRRPSPTSSRGSWTGRRALRLSGGHPQSSRTLDCRVRLPTAGVWSVEPGSCSLCPTTQRGPPGRDPDLPLGSDHDPWESGRGGPCVRFSRGRDQGRAVLPTTETSDLKLSVLDRTLVPTFRVRNQ